MFSQWWHCSTPGGVGRVPSLPRGEGCARGACAHASRWSGWYPWNAVQLSRAHLSFPRATHTHTHTHTQTHERESSQQRSATATWNGTHDGSVIMIDETAPAQRIAAAQHTATPLFVAQKTERQKCGCLHAKAQLENINGVGACTSTPCHTHPRGRKVG